MGNHSVEANGGAGSGFKGYIKLSDTGTYKITVGKGGTSYYAAGSLKGETGENSVFQYGTNILLTCGGGTGASTRGTREGWAGKGGKIVTYNLNTYGTIIKNDGSDGNSAGKSGKAIAPDGPIPNHTYGKAGDSFCLFTGGAVNPSYHGYGSIKYICPYIIEYKNPGSYLFKLNKSAIFKLKMVAGGGGGCGNWSSNSLYSGCSGAGGGGITGLIRLNPGSYQVDVGTGGKGTGGMEWQGISGTAGGNTVLRSGPSILVECTGGTGGRAYFPSKYQLGTRGTSNYLGEYLYTSIEQYPGSSGSGGLNNGEIYTCPSTISGITFGAGGSGSGSTTSFTGRDGNCGYFSLEFVKLD